MTPGSPEWARRVSPSKAAAILGISPWDSQRSIWHKMRGDIPWDDESPAMERGNLLEAGVLAWWRKHHDHGEWAEQATHTIEDWCVATPDAVTEDDDGELAIVEAKTSSDDSQWGTPETDQIPDYYLTQVYVAMHVCNLAGTPVVRSHVPILGPRLRFANYVVPYDATVGAVLLDRLRAFYDTLDGQPPDLDDTISTYDAVRRVHPDIDQGAVVLLDEAVAAEFVNALANMNGADARYRLARSTVTALMGRAQYAECNGVTIARRQANGTGGASVRHVAKDTTFTTKETAA